MFQLQLKFHNQGDWENMVFMPMPLDNAVKLCKIYQQKWNGIHSYRIINAEACK